MLLWDGPRALKHGKELQTQPTSVLSLKFVT